MVLLNLELQCAAPLRYNQTELFCTLTRYLILNHISDSEYVVSYRYSLHYFILSLYINNLYINSLYINRPCESTCTLLLSGYLRHPLNRAVPHDLG